MRLSRSVLATGVLVGGGLVAALLFVEFEAPGLGRAALLRLGSAVGARVDARAFRFRLIRGLALEELTATSDVAGGRWTLSTEALVLDHRLWPLLGGRVEIERIVLRRPTLRLEQGAARARARARGRASRRGRPGPARGRGADEPGTVEVVSDAGAAAPHGLQPRLHDARPGPRGPQPLEPARHRPRERRLRPLRADGGHGPGHGVQA